MIIKLLVEGGSMKPGPALSQKIGPLGINVGEIISKVNEATEGFKGLKVPVELDVDASTKKFEIKVFSPPVSELIKREIKAEKGSGEQKKIQISNVSIEQIISIAKTKMQNLLCKDLKAGVKSIVGTCASLGVLVESKPATEIGPDIDSGKYDKEISEGKTETSPEKRKELDEFFTNLHSAQEKQIQLEKAAAQAEEEAKTAQAAAKPAAGAAPAAEAKPKAAAKPAKK
jgi:large subunit ribosomal protein L11